MKRILLVGALAVAWAAPAAAQRSPLFMCLQLAPAGLSVETMLAECRLEVRDWLATCEQTRPVEACQQAVAEEANAAAAHKGEQRP